MVYAKRLCPEQALDYSGRCTTGSLQRRLRCDDGNMLVADHYADVRIMPISAQTPPLQGASAPSLSA